MKRLLTLIGNTALIFGASFSVMGAIISSFSFPVEIWTLANVLLAAAFALSTITVFLRGKGLLIMILPALALLIWKMSEVVDGAQYVLYYISSEFNRWLFVPILFEDVNAYPYDQTHFFAAAGVALAFLLSIAISLRRSAFLMLLFTIPIISLSFILVTHQPDYRYLLCLLAVFFTLLLSGAIHPDDFSKRGTAVFPALLLAAALMGFSFFMAQPDNFSRDVGITALDARIRVVATRLGISRVKTGYGWPESASDRWRFDTSVVGISEAGTRVIKDQGLLEVNVSGPGTFYLRGYSMQNFDGHAWRNNSGIHQTYSDEWLSRAAPSVIVNHYGALHSRDNSPELNMTITKTGDVTANLFYTPYYTFINDAQGQSYSVDFYHPQDSILHLYEALHDEYGLEIEGWLDFPDYAALVYSSDVYLQIEEETAEGLLRIALDAGIDPTADRATIADSVAAYISSVGRYTLSPYVVPADEDFVLFFLQVSRQGYCIHYTTAATLMLRALGVPARFTCGYAVSIPQDSVGKTVEVTDRNAHAWVEVFYDEVGWLPLEVTPFSEGYGIPDGRPHSGGGSSPGTGFSDPDWSYDPFDHIPDPWEGGDDIGAPTPGAGLGGGGGQEDKRTLSPSEVFVLLVVAIVVIIVALVIHRTVALAHRKKHFAMGDTNAAVIHAWRYITRLSRKMSPSEEYLDLALKARFSQHRITEEERVSMVEYAAFFAGEAYGRRGTLGRFWIKYVRGL